jgi:hypothetical protein
MKGCVILKQIFRRIRFNQTLDRSLRTNLDEDVAAGVKRGGAASVPLRDARDSANLAADVNPAAAEPPCVVPDVTLCNFGKFLYVSLMKVVISKRRTHAINLNAIGELPPFGLTLAK